MMGSTTNRDSKDILYLVKEGTVGAEIGVWMGNTSINFANKNPAELHLVDSWSIEPYKESTEHGSYENYLQRYSSVCGGNTEEQFQQKYDSVYRGVVKRFKELSNVHIHRMSSDEWFDQREENSLDWIYVDGDHSYEGCLRDLENSFRVVKSGGLILGDDYQWPFQKHGKAGVTSAVDEFVKKYSLKIIQEGATTQFSIEVP